jgi:outer membrane receptor protein involved in Fe transport
LAAVNFSEQGYYTNSITGNDVGGSSGSGGALTAVWRPADAVKIKTRVEYSEEHFDPRPVANVLGDNKFFLPESAKAIARPIITGDPITQKSSATSTNLFNFGEYCPKLGTPFYTSNTGNPLTEADVTITGAPAFCLPGIIKDAKGLTIAQSEDELTGTDFPGTDTEAFRASLIATFDLGHGLLSSYTGWTDFDSTDNYDQDYQASTAPDLNGNGSRSYATTDPRGGRLDTLWGHQEANQETSTTQFSQEFRFETQWDSPVKLTGGILFWQDHRELLDRNNITFCAPFGRTVNVQPLRTDPNDPLSPIVQYDAAPTVPGLQLANVEDNTTGGLRYFQDLCDTSVRDGVATSWQEYRRTFADPLFATRWDAETRHLSFYAMAEWQLSDDLRMVLENRLVNEEFSLLKPSSSSCTELAAVIGGNPTGRWDNNVLQICDIERVVDNNVPPGAPNGNLGLRYYEGSTYSNYNTPKVTLQWNPIEDLQTYFSWGRAQKPGGINQTAGGGTADAAPIETERFDPEKLDAWELGIKSSFELGGFWRANGSIFLNDYVAKQVGIQVVGPDGVSQPRIINAGRAEVFGLEFDLIWQPEFMEGLTLGFGGLVQDAKYTDFVDDTRNLVKAARYGQGEAGGGVGQCPIIYKYVDSTGQNIESANLTDFTLIDTNLDGSVDNRDGQPEAYCRLDYSDNDLERAPKQSYTASMQIQRPFLDTPFEYLFEVSGSWQDERWLDPENLVKVADYALLDMKLGLISDKWDVIAYVDNVLDDDRIKTAGSGPDFGAQVTQLGFTAGFGTTHYFATLPDPRVFGIRGSYRFGAGR